MKTMKKILVLVLCFSLCLGLAMPAMAAGETNDQGVIFSVELDKEEVESGSTDQTVVMTLTTNKPVTMGSIGFTVTWDMDSGVKFIGITENLDNFEYYEDGLDYETGMVGAYTDENLSDITELAIITFKIPANTPAGTYEFGVKDIDVTKDFGEAWEGAAYATSTLTITNPPEITGYSAGVSTVTPEVTEDDLVTVAVSVNHVSETTFNAAELIFSYDPEALAFNERESTLGTASVKDRNGKLTLEDYGDDKNCGKGVYTLAFDAIEDGVSKVKLDSVLASNKEHAASNDLVEGVAYPASVTIVVAKKIFDVKLPEGMAGNAVVTDGESYTFAIADKNYNYSDVTATVDGEPVEVTDNGDGTFTIAAVAGELQISVTRTPRSYKVSVSGNASGDIMDASESATYNTDYSFTLPNVTGWAYSLSSITIDGVAYTGFSVSDSVYTIPGKDITGEIVITVAKERVTTAVTVEGTGAGAAAGYAVSANVGQPYTLTIAPEAGYVYTVTAVMAGEPAELTRSGNSYTIASVTGDIKFTVNRVVMVDGVSISEYVTINGKTIWLVKNAITLADGKVLTYGGKNMFWSEAYDAYCYLVIAETLSLETAKAAINIADGAAVEIDYGMDVNMTDKVDANDAQLAYDIYRVLYNDFKTVSVEKMLRADVNWDGKVDTEDAAAIISEILK